MASANVPLSLTIKAVDKATVPLTGIQAAIKRLEKPAGKVGASFKKVGSEAFSLGAKIIGMTAGAGLGLFAIAHSAMEAGDKLSEMAQRVGLGVDAFASLSFAAAQADVDQDQFNAAMDQFNKRLGEAKAGGGPLLAFLNKVSPSLAKSVKHAKTTEEAFGLMTNAFEKVHDPGKRAALAAEAFGKSGLQMGQFLGQGSAAIEEQRKRYLALSGSQEQFADRSSILDNTLRETGTAFLGLRNGMMNALFPAFNRLATMLTNFIVNNREGLIKWAEDANGAFQEWANNGGFEKLIKNLKELADKALSFVDKIGGLKGALIGAAGVMSLDFGGAVVGLLANLVKLNFALTTTKGGLAGLVFAPVIGMFGNFIIALRAGYAPLQAFNLAFGVTAATAGAVAIAVVAVGAAIYQLVKHWDELKESGFNDWLAFGRAGLSKIGLVSAETDEEAMARMNGHMETYTAGATARKTIFTGQPSTGAAGAGPQATNHTNHAHVTLEVKGASPGSKLTVSPKSKAAVDTSLGINMGGM